MGPRTTRERGLDSGSGPCGAFVSRAEWIERRGEEKERAVRREWLGPGWFWVELVGSLGVGLGVWAPFLISFLFYFFSFLNLILIQLKTNEFKFKFEFTQALNK